MEAETHRCSMESHVHVDVVMVTALVGLLVDVFKSFDDFTGAILAFFLQPVNRK